MLSETGSYSSRTEYKEREEFRGVCWKDWKHVLFKHLKTRGYGDHSREFENNGVEIILHEWFVLKMKRKLMLDKDIEEKIDEFRERLREDEYTKMFKKPEVVEAFRFIAEKTKISQENISIKYRR